MSLVPSEATGPSSSPSNPMEPTKIIKNPTTDKKSLTPHFSTKTIKKIVEFIPDRSVHTGSTCLVLIGRATELFIADMCKMAAAKHGKAGEVEYKELAMLVEQNSKLKFLENSLPQKVTAQRAKELIEKAMKNAESDFEYLSDSDAE